MNHSDFIEISNLPDSTSIQIYFISRPIEEVLKQNLESVLSKYDKGSLHPVIYTILKELVINACKANQKRVFFDEHSYDILNPEHYSVGIKEYKKVFSEEMSEGYGIRSKEKGYYCLVQFIHSPDGMTVKVENNTPIVKQEEISIREKLGKAIQYDDLAMFYMDNADNSEGAGLGLALTIIMLKSEGIDPKYFRIITSKETTVARLEIPFTEQFVSKRNRV
jgi:hypothetical protein